MPEDIVQFRLPGSFAIYKLFWGLVYDCNKSFEGFIYERAHGYKIYTIVTEVLSHKDYYGIDEFIYQIKNIKVNSIVERMEPVSKKISYPEVGFTRK